MDAASSENAKREFLRNSMAAFLQIAAVVLLVALGLWIVAPFVTLVIWGVIISVAVFPAHQRLTETLSGREKLSAGLLVLIGLVILVVPTWMMTESGVSAARDLGASMQDGAIAIPPPADKVADWPVIGKQLHSRWGEAAEDLEGLINQFQPQLVTLGQAVVKGVGATVLGIVQFVFSIFVAGALLLGAKSGYRSSCAIATALAGDRGKAYTDMSIATIRSVSKGVVGVAIIQALLAGIGMVVADVPAAGIWTALVLVLAVVQLPPLLVLGPVAVWVFSVSEPLPATIFAIYAVLVSLLDSVLKPLFLGRGMSIPTLVILIGAIGGAISAGLLGLFLGPVVLAVGYTIVTEWMASHAPAESEQD
jgi:predicted PurR-regulated permease PerM